jgi:V-type H+-transporting ATPase subunit a
MMKQSGSVFQGLVWCPKSFGFGNMIADIINNQGLQGLNVQKGPDELPGLTKPTLFKTNEFTAVFQQIVDTYGIPCYKEVNPAIFTCVSFPFFFGVMFGDIMHGFLVFVFASYLCFKKDEPGLLQAFRPLRYMLLLMGFFSFYVGLIYNDFSSLATQIFGKTCWSVAVDAEPVAGSPGFYYATQADKDCVYPFGMDHTWYRATQEIGVMNSLKMKTSVIYGVAQMLLGTSMKGFNALYFKRFGEFFFDAISQIFLLLALFGFMDYMIIVKWTTDWDAHKAATSEAAPGIIGSMILMFIQGGNKPSPSPGEPVSADVMPDQTNTMQTMLLVAAVCVPTMLLANPILFLICPGKKARKVDEIEMSQIDSRAAQNDDY